MGHGQSLHDEERKYPGFYRMFEIPGTRFKTQALRELADAQVKQTLFSSSTLPAGYTYLAQFIDHDISRIGTRNRPPSENPIPIHDISLLTSPALDLSSLYGPAPKQEQTPGHADSPGEDSPPDEDTQPAGATPLGDEPTFDDRGRFEGWAPGQPSFLIDVNRHDAGEGGRQKRLAKIPDRRNDEHLIISQLHVLFMNLHNRIIDGIVPDEVDEIGPDHRFFKRAKRLVVLLYQAVIRHDLLTKILDEQVLDTLFEDHGIPPLLDIAPSEDASIPIEFAGAAFRFGHSMVQPAYDIGDDVRLSLRRLSEVLGSANEGPDRRPEHRVKWEHFFDLGNVTPNQARPISWNLIKELSELGQLPGNAGSPSDADEHEHGEARGGGPIGLAGRNLLRGKELDLPYAQRIIWRLAKVRKDYVDAVGLAEQAIDERRFGGFPLLLDVLRKWGFENRTPLWTYVLLEPVPRQAEPHEARLGKLGSTVVGEVFRCLLTTSEPSILNADDRRALEDYIGKPATEVTMRDLISMARAT